jgi:hypothetical protein
MFENPLGERNSADKLRQSFVNVAFGFITLSTKKS